MTNFVPGTVLANAVILLNRLAFAMYRLQTTIYLGMITLSVHWMCWRPVTHAQTQASYSAVYRLCSLSFTYSQKLLASYILNNNGN